jgi:hypothetical protein
VRGIGQAQSAARRGRRALGARARGFRGGFGGTVGEAPDGNKGLDGRIANAVRRAEARASKTRRCVTLDAEERFAMLSRLVEDTKLRRGISGGSVETKEQVQLQGA